MKKISFDLGEGIVAFTTLKDKETDDIKKNIAEELGIAPKDLFIPGQTHSAKVEIVDRLSSPDEEEMQGVDALVTQESRLALAVRTADCMPVFFFDPVVRVVAMAHGGWRGLVAGILENTVANMINVGAKPPRIKIVFGPHISVGSYEVGEDIITDFENDEILKRGTRFYADLAKVAANRLARVGVRPENISNSDIDTFTEVDCYSARRDGMQTGRMYSVVMMVR